MAIDGPDHEPHLEPAEAELAREIRAAVAKSPRPIPKEFGHVSDADAEADQEEAERIRDGYRRSGTIRRPLLEQFMQQLAERSNWFGGEAFVFATTDFDDLKNGIDAIIEWTPEEDGGVTPRLAVDFTTSSTLEGLGPKLAKIKQGGYVKYFRSEVETNEDGDPSERSLSDLPMAVLGFDIDLFGYFAKDIQSARKIPVPNPAFDVKKFEKYKQETPDNRKFISPAAAVREVLENSPYKILLLLQASAQLATQSDNPMATLCYDRIQLELESLMFAKDNAGDELVPKKYSPEYQRALRIGKISTTHRELTLSEKPTHS